MKNITQIRKILEGSSAVEAHIHTHLCDGGLEMTVENIARRAESEKIDTVILTPHFHKRVSDGTDYLYEDSDESIFTALREEIDSYEARGGSVRVILSAEADILSPSGEMALPSSSEALDALDLVTPTMNYHPLLPLKFVRLTYGKEVDRLHESGEYAEAARAAGGVEYLLRTMYDTQVNAILHCPYPAMLGHFFAAHSVHPDRHTWFGAREEHLPLMLEGAERVVEACRKKAAILDLTGVHMKADTVEQKRAKNGFLWDFQRFTVKKCLDSDVFLVAGADSHRLSAIGRSRGYYDALFGLLKDEK